MSKDNNGFRKALTYGVTGTLAAAAVTGVTLQPTQDNEVSSHYTFAGITTKDTEGTIISDSGVGEKVEIPEGTLLGGIQTYTDKNQEYVIVEARIPTKTEEGLETTKIATVLISTENTKTVPINENNEIKPDCIGITYSDIYDNYVTEQPGEPNSENEVLDTVKNFSDVLACQDIKSDNKYVTVYTVKGDGYGDEMICGYMRNDFVSRYAGTPENRYWDLSKFDKVIKSYMKEKQKAER